MTHGATVARMDLMRSLYLKDDHGHYVKIDLARCLVQRDGTVTVSVGKGGQTDHRPLGQIDPKVARLLHVEAESRRRELEELEATMNAQGGR